MSECDEALSAVLLDRARDPALVAHLQSCARCAAEAPVLRALGQTLGAYSVPDPSPALGARVAAAAGPLLARSRPAAWPAVARSLAAGIVPLPAVLFANALALRTAYRLLSAVLPQALSMYMVASYGAWLAVLLGLTYAAIPVLAERQARLRHEESHA